MKRFKTQQVYYVFIMLILGILLITGCGSGGETEHWAPADTTAPTVTLTIPADLATTGVAISDPVTATFSEAMKASTIIATGTFTVYDTTTNNAVSGTVTYDALTWIATFTPSSPLTADDHYRATITTAATDLAGNPLISGAVPNPWTFATINTGIIPGTACVIDSGPTIPTVTSSNPSDGNLLVTTSTTGHTGKLITATFSIPMDLATITPTGTFTLKDTTYGTTQLGTVTMNASRTTATLTTTAALSPGITYRAIITTAAKSEGGVAISCPYAWTFRTVNPAAAGLAPVDLGLAAPFAIASAADLTNTTNAPITHINGNVVLFPTSTCNADVLLLSDGPGFGTCKSGASTGPPTHNAGDLVISGAYPDAGLTAAAVRTDLQAAYVSLSPPAAAPAGPLGPGTTILVPTTLGTGSTGGNTFTPGLYTDLAAGIQIQGDLTLDALGNQDALFVFQTAGTLTTLANTRILLTGGAKASNVFWQVGSSATLGTGTEFQGNILADTSITMLLGTTSCGRLLAGAYTVTGAFVFDSNIVAVPGNPFVPGGSRSALCQ